MQAKGRWTEDSMSWPGLAAETQLLVNGAVVMRWVMYIVIGNLQVETLWTTVAVERLACGDSAAHATVVREDDAVRNKHVAQLQRRPSKPHRQRRFFDPTKRGCCYTGQGERSAWG